MTKIFSNKLFSRVTCLMLTAIFLAPFSTSAAALALCLDEEDSHIVGQVSNLADCHSSVEENLLLSEEPCSAFVKKESNDCVDVSLTNATVLNSPSKLFLPVPAKVIFSYALTVSLIGFQQQVAGYTSSAFSHPLLAASLLEIHRTVVLLI